MRRLLLAAVLAQPATARRPRPTRPPRRSPSTRPPDRNARHRQLRRRQQVHFDTAADLLTPDGPTGFPGDLWARQTITLRSSDRNVWQEASYSAPSGNPRDIKGANHDNVLSKMYKAPSNVEISMTYFGGGPLERFPTDGDSSPPTGAPASRTPRPTSSPARRSRWSTRGEPHHADRLRTDHVQLARQAEQPLARHGEQDLLGAARDRQAAGVEEVRARRVILDDARARRTGPSGTRRAPAGSARRSACARSTAGPGSWPPTASCAMR